MAAEDYIFNGETKEIIIVSGVTSVEVQDMYSRWKDWTQISDNSKFLQAFRTFGGDQTIPGQFAPRYYFLTNGWRVIVNYDNVDFSTNLYTDENDRPVLTNSGATASVFNSDAVNVESEVSQTLDYGGSVAINTLVGVNGSSYPTGTLAQPVNNLSDAKKIAQERSLSTIKIFGTINFDVDLFNFEVIGGNIRDVVIFQDVNVSGTTFKECVLSGTYSGYIAGETVQLADNITIGGGLFKDSGLQGRVNVMNGSDVSILNSSSLVPGNSSPSLYLGNNISLNLRKYSGGMTVYDVKSGTTATLEFLAGNCRVLSGCTGGELEIRGIAKLTNQSSGTTIGTDGLLVPYQVAQQHTLNVNTEITKNK